MSWCISSRQLACTLINAFQRECSDFNLVQNALYFDYKAMAPTHVCRKHEHSFEKLHVGHECCSCASECGFARYLPLNEQGDWSCIPGLRTQCSCCQIEVWHEARYASHHMSCKQRSRQHSHALLQCHRLIPHHNHQCKEWHAADCDGVLETLYHTHGRCLKAQHRTHDETSPIAMQCGKLMQWSAKVEMKTYTRARVTEPASPSIQTTALACHNVVQLQTGEVSSRCMCHACRHCPRVWYRVSRPPAQSTACHFRPEDHCEVRVDDAVDAHVSDVCSAQQLMQRALHEAPRHTHVQQQE